MSWRFPDWDQDILNHARRTWVPETGGWIYQIRDQNNAFSDVWIPDLVTWANAIGAAMVAAQTAAQPVGIALDVSRVRHAKQPRPGS